MNKKRGFTLIELLVVVLIIGILSAIALPQYQRAVFKARMTEVLVRTQTLEKAAEAYILENGFPGVSEDRVYIENVNPDSMAGLTQSTTNEHVYYSKYASYTLYCWSAQCTLIGTLYLNGLPSAGGGSDYVRFDRYFFKSTYQWDRNCAYKSSSALGTYLCTDASKWGYHPYLIDS